MADETPTRLEALTAYAISAATTLLWVACVLPAGTLAAPTHVGSDAATPIHRETVLLVPALLLLVLVPTGCMLARRLRGMRAVLAGTDGFVATFAGVALIPALVPVAQSAGEHEVIAGGTTTLIGIVLLLALGALSALEAWRCARDSAPEWHRGRFAGARLAICLLVLIVPLHVVLQRDVERASLLAPFVFVAVSAAGVRLARDMRGLRRTAGILQLLLAVHVLITLRYTMFRRDPVLQEVGPTGRVALALAVAVVSLAGLQLLLFLRRGAAPEPVPQPATAPNE